jgi:hypothetical protein
MSRPILASAMIPLPALLIAVASFAQTPTLQNPRYPIQLDANVSAPLFPHLKYLTPDLLSAETKRALNREVEAAVTGNPNSIEASAIASVPRWSGSFAFDGPVQPFIMVGSFPQTTGKTFVNVQLVPIKLVFDGIINPLTLTTAVIKPGPVLAPTLAGPDFVKASYTDGFVQFGDAVQRAEFQPVRAPGWHTVLNPPTLLPTVKIDVPAGVFELFQLPDGRLFCLLDANFLESELMTLLSSEPLAPGRLRIYLIRNTFLFENGNPSDCCVAGLHSAIEAVSGSETLVQTFAYATWIDSDVAAQFIGDPTYADVVALSHEISEWMNDPFTTNAVIPSWQFPGEPGACQGNLETGDPVEVLAPDLRTFPVTIGGFTYHPQNEALLQWFAQVSPSNALDGAYSYPNESSLTSPSLSCP